MALTIFGIRNCDTTKKARAWLDAAGKSYAFHDYKTAGIDAGLLHAWVAELGWETVLNRAGTTFRGLADVDKAGVDAEKAIVLMVANPSLIKRPMLVGDGILIAGFKPETYAAALR
ncbi:ArsC family transcriptional regulator [alpha proteobacterium AAP81b]|nr:ArsC family transcriptional regulator [alpha proteobacterium AAP81b]